MNEPAFFTASNKFAVLVIPGENTLLWHLYWDTHEILVCQACYIYKKVGTRFCSGRGIALYSFLKLLPFKKDSWKESFEKLQSTLVFPGISDHNGDSLK